MVNPRFDRFAWSPRPPTLKLGIKLGGYYKKITIHKHLVSATAEVAGQVRDRYDCETRVASASG